MRIAYRRMSGGVSFSSAAKGSRGLWWEKRQGLVRWLIKRGHQVDLVSKLQKGSDSGLLGLAPYDAARHELLMVEFGSSNERFNGDDLAETARIANAHKGQAIFLCDDPDLPFLWERIERPERWVQWLNATRPGTVGKQPASVPSVDFPFAATLPVRVTTGYDYGELPRDPELVYLGRPNGRVKAMRSALSSGVPIAVYSNPKDWSDFEGLAVGDPPAQPQRSAWYARKTASLVLADAKHKSLGFRTGRAFHALCAGTPFLYENDHPAFDGYLGGFTTPDDLRGWWEALVDSATRVSLREQQQQRLEQERQVCHATATAVGL